MPFAILVQCPTQDQCNVKDTGIVWRESEALVSTLSIWRKWICFSHATQRRCAKMAESTRTQNNRSKARTNKPCFKSEAWNRNNRGKRNQRERAARKESRTKTSNSLSSPSEPKDAEPTGRKIYQSFPVLLDLYRNQKLPRLWKLQILQKRRHEVF